MLLLSMSGNHLLGDSYHKCLDDRVFLSFLRSAEVCVDRQLHLLVGQLELSEACFPASSA